jgi:ACR3 family arsenite efflux pump ArsB
MDRSTLERRQVWIYLTAIGLGLAAGSVWPRAGPLFEGLLWPALAVLLLVTFLQVPLLHLAAAFRDRRFVATVSVGNFVLMPLLVWGLVQFLPDDPVLRLGVLLVLLVPCTDWFITFSQLGGGDVPKAIAVTPLNLFLQLLLLPLYLWLMGRPHLAGGLGPVEVWPALLVVGLPLVIAALAERWIEARPERAPVRARMAWWPVPLLAGVMFLIAGAQVDAVLDALPLLPVVLPVFAAYLLLGLVLARGLARLTRLPSAQGRTLAFSLGTRNSFVVLPLALALPAEWEAAAVVIVLQSLVELLGMLAYLVWVPRLFADDPPAAGGRRWLAGGERES